MSLGFRSVACVKSIRDAAGIQLPAYLSPPRSSNFSPARLSARIDCYLDHLPLPEFRIDGLDTLRYGNHAEVQESWRIALSLVFSLAPRKTLATMESETKKTTVTATTTALARDDGALAAEESGSARPDRNVAAAIWAIVCGVALPCIQVIIISAVLM